MDGKKIIYFYSSAVQSMLIASKLSALIHNTTSLLCLQTIFAQNEEN